MNIYIDVKNRIATYRSLGTDPVCGCNSDQYKFNFDSEWENVNPKTARFIWGEKYYDVEFEGDTCGAPLFENVSRVLVGVYAGEPADEESSFSTTKAEVPYGLSIRCGYHSPRVESGNGYTNEAKGYAAEAREAAKLASELTEEASKLAERAEQSIEEAYGMTEVGRITIPLVIEERYDEEIGWYVYPWGIGENLINYKNGGMLLYAFDEMNLTPSPVAGYEMLRTLMQCPVSRITVEAPDLNGMLDYRILYDAPGDGEHWLRIEIPGSSSADQWVLPDQEWQEGGVRLVVFDNQEAPYPGVGPKAIFIQFPKAFKKAMESYLFSPGNPNERAVMTVIGYK